MKLFCIASLFLAATLAGCGIARQDVNEPLDAERIQAKSLVTDVVDLPGLPAAFEALKQPTTQCKVIVEPA